MRRPTWFPDEDLVLMLALAGVLLFFASRLPTPGWFFSDRVGSAGEWFAGAVGALVLIWAINEPQRQRAHNEHVDRLAAQRQLVEEVERRVAEARAVVLYDTALALEGRGGDWDEYVLRGTIGNYSSAPIRRVFVLVDWWPDAAATVARSGPGGGATDRFFVADVIAPSGTTGLIEDHGALRFLLEKGRGQRNADIAHLRVHFRDVHGDHWVGWFGPSTHEAHVQLVKGGAFWTDVPPERVPSSSPETLCAVAPVNTADQ